MRRTDAGFPRGDRARRAAHPCAYLILSSPYRSDSYILPAELRSAINEYITQADLINQHDAKYVNLDDSLSAALLKKGENLGFLPRSELLDRLLNSMQAWYRLLIRENGKVEEILTKGTPQKIAVSVKKRQGKKLVTIIDGEHLSMNAFKRVSSLSF